MFPGEEIAERSVATNDQSGNGCWYPTPAKINRYENVRPSAKNFVGLLNEPNVADLRKMLIQEEREKYLRGEGKSYSWDEVKKAARNKELRLG